MAAPAPIGTADHPDAGRIQSATRAVIDLVTHRYGVVVTRDVVSEDLKGDLDGAEIVIGADGDPETALFLVAHLFGHTVQWNTDPNRRELGLIAPTAMPRSRLPELEDYEAEACRYGLALFHEAGVLDLDQWLADYAACDRAYLRHFHETGSLGVFRHFWRSGQPLLAPLQIPAFTPRRWRLRGRGIVV